MHPKAFFSRKLQLPGPIGVLARRLFGTIAARLRHLAGKAGRRPGPGLGQVGGGSKARSLSLGVEGEAAAERFLRGLGYRLLARSVRGRRGELDLVMDDRGTVVFVEVKARSSSWLPAESAVDRRKRRRVERTALAWLLRAGMSGRPARFDVVAVQAGRVRHIPGAWM